MTLMRIYAILTILFLFAGCSFKGDLIHFDEHKSAFYAQKASVKKIEIADFSDARREKPIVATIIGLNGEKVKTIFTDEDLGEWLKRAFSKELSEATISSDSISPIIVNAKINEFYLEYTRNPAETKNLHVSAKVEMILSYNLKTYKRDYFLNESKYAPMINNSKDLVQYLQPSLNQITSSMVADVIKWSGAN
jgi:hypothetical protein